MASADPFALVLANSETAPEITDSAAANAQESFGEPATEGNLDAADLSKLGNRLSSIALSYEAFRDVSALDADAKALVDYTSPRGLIQNPADRAQTLDRVYRALALIDDTRALRYPEGEACARAHRRALLRSSDGLFADPKTGELTPWLKAELKRSMAGEVPAGLIAASAREWTALGYLKSLAEVRTLSLQLGDGKILGSPRAAAFCRRAKVFEELASAQTALKWNDPDLTAQTGAVVEVRWGKAKGTGTVILLGDKPVALVSSRFTQNAYETPDLFTKSGTRLPASYLRRGPALSVLSVQPGAGVEPLAIPVNPKQEEYVAYAVGHPIQGGPWSVTRGLARLDNTLIRADAAVDDAQAGGPLFDAQGRLAGIVAGQGIAYDLAAIKTWLKDEKVELPEAIGAPDLGTGALLAASSIAIPEEKSVLIESGIVCKDVRGCAWPPPSASAPPSWGIDHSAPYNGPNLWSILGKILSRPPKTPQPIQDNSGYAQAAVIPALPVVQQPPKPPPDPLRPNSLKLSVSRTSMAQGEEVEAIATVDFTGKDGSREGRRVSFSVVPGGKLICPPGTTDASGIARAKCQAVIVEGDRTFDSLRDEERRRRGLKTPGRIKRKPAEGDKIGVLKETEADSIRALDNEEEKYPELGNMGSDTPGIDKPHPETEVAELEIKGDRVTLSSSIDKYQDHADLDILERPCFDGSVPERVGDIGALSRYRCRAARPSGTSKIGDRGMSMSEAPSEGQSPDAGDSKPAVESRPVNAPTGTKPIDRSGLTHDEIHDIKKGLRAGAKDWVGISPNDDVITTGSDGRAINNGSLEDFTHRRR